jgi:hypothetical protein
MLVNAVMTTGLLTKKQLVTLCQEMSGKQLEVGWPVLAAPDQNPAVVAQ